MNGFRQFGGLIGIAACRAAFAVWMLFPLVALPVAEAHVTAVVGRVRYCERMDVSTR